MKKALALIISLMMMVMTIGVVAEDVDAAAETYTEPEFDKGELTVGMMTPLTGNFFSDMWGKVTSDLDIRFLLHGYDLVEWRHDVGRFDLDTSVVSGSVITQNRAGNRTYTLTLYDDLTYNDGTPITAADYAFSILLSIAPEVADIGGTIKPREYLVGYDDYASGKVPYLAGVRLISDDTIAFTVSADYLPFFYEAALLECTPYPISVIAPGCKVADDGKGIYITNQDADEEDPIFMAELLWQTILDPNKGYLSHPMLTSGPYKLVSYDGETVELEINEYYKGNSDGMKPIIPKLYCKTVTNDTAVEMLAKGEIDVINKVVSSKVIDDGNELVSSSDALSTVDYKRSGLSFISFCCEKAPVDSAAVRQAISMCLDKDGIVSDAVGSYGMRADGYYGEGQWMYAMVEEGFRPPVPEPAEDADQEEIDAYDAAIAEWEALSLDDVKVYDFSVDEAVELLVSEGWTLNREGGEFDPENDDVRCHISDDGELQALELKMLVPEGSSLNAHYEERFTANLNAAGIALTIEEMPLSELLEYYYRRVERDCDMIALATNFDLVFDPSYTFDPAEAKISVSPAGTLNPTAIDDEELYRHAVDMRKTDPEDPLSYCRKWIELQRRFQEIVPAIPIYSNVYHDFYPSALQGYDLVSSVSWSKAIIGAWMQ